MNEMPNNSSKESVEKLENIGGAKEQLTSLLENEQYIEGFAHIETSNERGVIETIEVEAAKEARKEMKLLVSQVAAESLGVTVEEGQRMGKDWGMAMNSVTSLEYQGETYELEKASNNDLLESIGKSIRQQPQFQAKLEEAEDQLTVRHSAAIDQITEMRTELLNSEEDQSLDSAFDAWGQAPDENGNKGKDGSGFNSGIIHYFQYRANEQKATRFKRDKVTFGINGFKQKTLDYVDAITDPEQESVISASIFSDEVGARRMVSLTDENEIIVAFANPNEELKIVTVFSQKNQKLGLKQYKSIVDKEVTMEVGADERLNKLGEGRKLDWEK